MIPKFRAIRKKRANWQKKGTVNKLIHSEDLSEMEDIYLSSSGELIEISHEEQVNVTDEWDVTFSTELFDKNGVEIFEGDIGEDILLGKYIVEKVNGGFVREYFKCLYYYHPDEPIKYLTLIENSYTYWNHEIHDYSLGLICEEIIGNKFGNPELCPKEEKS